MLKKGFTKDEGGSTAVEFVLVAPALLAVLFATIHLGLLVFTVASLHYAVEKGVRCGSLKLDCSKTKEHYFAPGPAPVFTYGTKECGTTLVAKVDYDLDLLAYRTTIPLSASACFP